MGATWLVTKTEISKFKSLTELMAGGSPKLLLAPRYLDHEEASVRV
jgi:hypothetical protein